MRSGQLGLWLGLMHPGFNKIDGNLPGIKIVGIHFALSRLCGIRPWPLLALQTVILSMLIYQPLPLVREGAPGLSNSIFAKAIRS
jgi:hypothetical protein